MKNKALAAIKKYGMLDNVTHVTVALSGGADSVSLLHLLASVKTEYGFTLAAVHINHGIRGAEADRDESFVRSLCRELLIPLYVHRRDVPALAASLGISEELAGRQVRYEIFEKYLSDGCVVATAHNLDDRAETFILNLSRGTGLHGLCSIPPVRDRYIRPLIDITKAEILAYCGENGLSYVTDSTNLCNDYTRNVVRHNIIPQLTALNPSFFKNFVRCEELLSRDDEYFSDITEKAFGRAKTADGYSAAVISEYPAAVRTRLLCKVTESLTGSDYEAVHISLLDSGLLSGCRVTLPGGEIIASDGKTVFLKKEEAPQTVPGDMPLESPGGSVTFGDYTVKTELSEKSAFDYKTEKNRYYLDRDKISGKIIISTRREGDKIRLAGHAHEKSLKKLFTEAHTDRNIRAVLPVFRDDEGIILLHGFGPDERVKVTPSTKNILLFTISEA